MSNLKQLLLFLLLFSSFLNADQEKRSSIYYVKLGGIHPPGDSADILPTLGIGARFQRDYHGFDISLNLGSLVFINYASLKGMFLFYPYPEKKHQLYYGLGSGIGYQLTSIPLGGLFGFVSSEYGNVTLEGVLGYEFRHARYFKTFIQIELSQPIFGFGGHGHRGGYKPGAALIAGFGF